MPTKAKQGELYTMSIAQKCKIDNCEGKLHINYKSKNKNQYTIKGYCQKHYRAYRLYGNPLFKHHDRDTNPPTLCRVRQCGEKNKAKGLCNKHYSRMYKTGTIEVTIEMRKLEKHGMSNTKLYKSWRSMVSRCHNPKNARYKHYGGAGISVCDRWRYSFINFYNDMGERPEGMSIDRINPFGNYEPSNCRWADVFTQANNTRKKYLLKSS